MRHKDRVEQIVDTIKRLISQFKDARDSENWAVISKLIGDLENQTEFLDNFIDLEEDE
jgi:undecaprenyl pyrophosphate synthase|tara:strand:+ start:2379 stop:2552 length:174 start_codon:yes stop_codon:yes gene_type:complete